MVSYEEQVTAIREQLADVLIDEEDWNQAAKTLAGIDLDSGEQTCTLPCCRAKVVLCQLDSNQRRTVLDRSIYIVVKGPVIEPEAAVPVFLTSLWRHACMWMAVDAKQMSKRWSSILLRALSRQSPILTKADLQA